MTLKGRKSGSLQRPCTVAGVQPRQLAAFHWQLILLVAMLLILVAPRSMAAQQAEDLYTTVQYLITYVKQSDVTFERNFSSYNGTDAAAHINKKYQHFKDEIDTPEKFIELCATASLMTRKPYLVTTKQGKQQPSSEWLNTELAVYRLRNEYTGP
jgi:hypothetical protein